MRARRVLVTVAAGAALLVAGVLSVPATTAAQEAPAVTTGSAGAVTSSSASVGGTVNPNGTATSYAFQYGTSTDYDEQTSSQPAGSGTSSQNVTATLSGLPSGRTIHYRIIATYGSGGASTVVGNDATFTTQGPSPTVPAPTATTGSATSVSAHGAQLNGTVGATTAGASYYFQYGTTTNYGVETSPVALTASTTSQSVKAVLSTLQAGVTYHYRLVTRSSSGLTSNGADQTFKTGYSPTPSVRTGSASGVTSSSAKVAGSVTPNGTTTSYAFQYGTSTGYGEQTPSQSAGSGTSTQNVSATLNGLSSGTTIHYRIIARYGSNEIVVGNDATFATAGPRPSIPAPSATTGAATRLGANGARLTGTVGPTAHAASYYFQYGLTATYGVETSPVTISASGSTRSVTASLNGLERGVTYHVRLVTRSATGLLATGADHTFSTSPPAPPPRMRPRGLSLTGHSAFRGRVVVLRSYGRLRLPAGVSTRDACRGRVWLLVKAGRFTLSWRAVALSSRCDYRERIAFGYRALHHRRHVRLRARFTGNAALLPARSRTAFVRA